MIYVNVILFAANLAFAFYGISRGCLAYPMFNMFAAGLVFKKIVEVILQ